MKSRQSGYTLVEIAIVLVIIGLLLGGVLKGQELIFNTKVKATYNLVQSMSAAFNSYQDRYQALPGDDPLAQTRFPAANPLPANGNGDGILAYGNCANPGTVTENCTALYDLRLAGFITGNYTDSVTAPFGGPSFPAAGNSQMGGAGFGSNPIMQFSVNTLTYKAASAIDTSFDDGNPATGDWRCNGLAAAGYNLSTPDVTIPQFCGMTL
ncbi:MAG TPA: prepilin-type N-terminal cleavage/methylation domain-containing protein [Burkholderiaceae bacterium]|nr:prepilin-type N-terminal cleavage/methylation domain-containing protein [Burkholderiaceae bacterium]